MRRRIIGLGLTLMLLAGCAIHLPGSGGSAAVAPPTPQPAGLLPNQWVEQAFPGMFGPQSGSVAFAPGAATVGYACVNGQTLAGAATPSPVPTLAATSTAVPILPVNLFATADAGQTWNAITAPAGITADCASSALIAPDATHATDLFLLVNTVPLSALHTVNPTAQTMLHLERSQDGGQTWQALKLPAPAPLATGVTLGLNPGHVSLTVTARHILLGTNTVGVGGALFASFDGGQSWTASSSPDGGQSSILATAPGPNGTMVTLATPALGAIDPHATLSAWITNDAIHWAKLSSLPALPASDTTTQPYTGVTLVSAPNGKTLVALELAKIDLSGSSASRLVRSTNGGTTWQALPVLAPVNQTNNPFDLAIAALQGTNLAVTNDGRVWAQPDAPNDLSGNNTPAPGIYAIGTGAGITWTNVTPPPAPQYVAQASLTVASTASRVIIWTGFTASDPDAGLNGLYHYVDAGP